MDSWRILIGFLMLKQYITTLEKDILNTWIELTKCPFDRNSAGYQVVSNSLKYFDDAAMMTLGFIMPQSYIGNITDNEIKFLLYMQWLVLLQKEVMAAENCQ